MSGSLLTIWLLALVLAGLALYRGGGGLGEGLLAGADQLVRVMPRVLMALTAAGFIAKLIPGEFIGAWLGPDSGFRGIAIAALAGLFVPAGPVVSFSLAAVLAQAGAATPQLVAFLTAWSVFAMHRITIYEAPMLGLRFLAVRLSASFTLPLVAGLTAVAVLNP
jgi:uncharacterized membrane protein YraQ (UPF0718 family)